MGERSLAYLSRTLRFRVLPTWETIYGENRSQEPCVSRKFDCSKTGEMEGLPFRVPFSDCTSVDLRMWVQMDLRSYFTWITQKFPEKIKYCFKEDSTQRIFCIEEEEIKDAYPGDSNEEGNEIVASSVQDVDSEVSLQEKQAIFAQSHNSVIVHHLGVDRTYKALKLRCHNW